MCPQADEAPDVVGDYMREAAGGKAPRPVEGGEFFGLARKGGVDCGIVGG